MLQPVTPPKRTSDKPHAGRPAPSGGPGRLRVPRALAPVLAAALAGLAVTAAFPPIGLWLSLIHI